MPRCARTTGRHRETSDMAISRNGERERAATAFRDAIARRTDIRNAHPWLERPVRPVREGKRAIFSQRARVAVKNQIACTPSSRKLATLRCGEYEEPYQLTRRSYRSR